MNNHITTFALMVTTIIGCAMYTPSSYASQKAGPSASYAGKTLNASDLQQQALMLFNGKFPEEKTQFSELPSQIQEAVIRKIVAEDLLLVEAKKAGFENSDTFKQQLENIKERLLRQELLQKEVQPKINEKSLKLRYEKYIKDFGKYKEAHLKHIFVNSEEKAKEILAEIKAGKTFEALANANSPDANNKENGGDLGYVAKDKLLKPLGDVAFSMKVGTISEPVKTDLGWHILKVEDIRDAKPIEFDQIKPQLEQVLSQELTEAYVDELLKSAKFKMELPNNAENAPASDKKPDAPAKSKK